MKFMLGLVGARSSRLRLVSAGLVLVYVLQSACAAPVAPTSSGPGEELSGTTAYDLVCELDGTGFVLCWPARGVQTLVSLVAVLGWLWDAAKNAGAGEAKEELRKAWNHLDQYAGSEPGRSDGRARFYRATLALPGSDDAALALYPALDANLHPGVEASLRNACRHASLTRRGFTRGRCVRAPIEVSRVWSADPVAGPWSKNLLLRVPTRTDDGRKWITLVSNPALKTLPFFEAIAAGGSGAVVGFMGRGRGNGDPGGYSVPPFPKSLAEILAKYIQGETGNLTEEAFKDLLEHLKKELQKWMAVLKALAEFSPAVLENACTDVLTLGYFCRAAEQCVSSDGYLRLRTFYETMLEALKQDAGSRNYFKGDRGVLSFVWLFLQPFDLKLNLTRWNIPQEKIVLDEHHSLRRIRILPKRSHKLLADALRDIYTQFCRGRDGFPEAIPAPPECPPPPAPPGRP